ncbi:MAG: hypothetical protein IT299_13640, partial [Dehalococcoidia bacterium]|nr:hypothetical protein [Dehalococcoidia bacterium]
CLALLGGPPAALAAIFALTAGFAVGLLSPVHGLLAASTYEDERLGTLSGVQQFVASIAGAAGPWLSGVLVDSTGGYLLPMTVPLAALVCAILVITYRGQTALEAQPATDYANP